MLSALGLTSASFGFSRLKTFLAVVGSAVLLAACATSLPPASAPEASAGVPTDFALEGRFSLRHEGHNYSGRLTWQHEGAGDDLLLSSPFGQGIAEITSNAQGATLVTAEGKTYSAEDAQLLTARVLGYPLPLVELTNWVRGRVVGTESVDRDANGRLLRLRHEDWRIDYSYGSDDPLALPDGFIAERVGGFELRLRIDEWTRVSWGGVQP